MASLMELLLVSLKLQYYLCIISRDESMKNYIKSKIQQSISFLPVMVMAFSVCSGVGFLNPSPSYAFSQEDVDKVRRGSKNLIYADLSKADLTAIDLTEADLSVAKLYGSILIGANLTGANLSSADLRGAYLNGSILTEANLKGAKLDYADLTEADLSRANLTFADLSRANLSRANLNEANLSRVNLRGARADARTIFPPGFDAKSAGVIFKQE